jgi:hypothetical protein
LAQRYDWLSGTDFIGGNEILLRRPNMVMLAMSPYAGKPANECAANPYRRRKGVQGFGIAGARSSVVAASKRQAPLRS